MTTGFDLQNKVRFFNSWTDLKPYVNGISASLAYNWEYTKNNEFYLVTTEPYVGFNYVCYLETTASAEKTDFETNFRNQPLRKPSGSFGDARLVNSSSQEIGVQERPIWITGSVTTAGGSSGGGTVTQGNQGTVAQPWFTQLTNGSVVIGNAISAPLFVSGTFTLNGSPNFASNGGTIPALGSLVGGTSNGTDFRALSTDGTGKLNVNATLSNPAVGGTGSLAPVSASLNGYRDLSGNIRAASGDNAGATYVATRESTAVDALGSLNAEVRLSLSGSTSVGLQLAAGTLVGTIAAEISYDNGTTWATTGFFDMDTKGLSDTVIFASANGATTKGVMVASGGGLVRVRVSAYTSGTANATLRVSNTAQQVTYVSQLDGRRNTYAAYTAAFASAATATDIFIIQGSATKTIRVLRIIIHVTRTTAAAGDIFLLKRSTANTLGTAVATAKIPYDSGYPAATATVQHYTANPTVGTSLGTVRAYRGIIPASATLINNPICNWDFGSFSGSSIVLKGTAESLAVNLNGVTFTGGSFIIGVEWTEE